MNDNRSDADKYRIRQAEKMFDLFEKANGKPPANSDELCNWMTSPDGHAVIARHLGNRSDADKYRIRQAEKMFDLFEKANGKRPANSDELCNWMTSPDGHAVIGRHLDEDGKIIP